MIRVEYHFPIPLFNTKKIFFFKPWPQLSQNLTRRRNELEELSGQLSACNQLQNSATSRLAELNVRVKKICDILSLSSR